LSGSQGPTFTHYNLNDSICDTGATGVYVVVGSLVHAKGVGEHTVLNYGLVNLDILEGACPDVTEDR
jgi:hypothetical protein